MWQGNQAVHEGGSTIDLPLGGLGIGNGLTNPEVQYAYYPEMVYNNSHHIKVVDEDTYEAMKSVVPKCQQLIHQCNAGDNAIDKFACQTAFYVCNMGLTRYVFIFLVSASSMWEYPYLKLRRPRQSLPNDWIESLRYSQKMRSSSSLLRL